MVEDVTTSGKSIEETYPITSQVNVNIEVAWPSLSHLNRMEVGKGGKVASRKSPSAGGTPTAAIAPHGEVTEALLQQEVDGKVIIDDT